MIATVAWKSDRSDDETGTQGRRTSRSSTSASKLGHSENMIGFSASNAWESTLAMLQAKKKRAASSHLLERSLDQTRATAFVLLWRQALTSRALRSGPHRRRKDVRGAPVDHHSAGRFLQARGSDRRERGGDARRGCSGRCAAPMSSDDEAARTCRTHLLESRSWLLHSLQRREFQNCFTCSACTSCLRRQWCLIVNILVWIRDELSKAHPKEPAAPRVTGKDLLGSLNRLGRLLDFRVCKNAQRTYHTFRLRSCRKQKEVSRKR